MKPFKGFDRSNTYKEREELPKGAYILEIKDATMVSGSYGDTLKISFDIAEGDKAGFYARNYKAQPAEDKKWKGTFRLSIPRSSMILTAIRELGCTVNHKDSFPAYFSISSGSISAFKVFASLFHPSFLPPIGKKTCVGEMHIPS